jgi:DNA-binding MarR family transcriptional regulator
MNEHSEQELIALEEIKRDPHIRQRDLATVIGVSLGMANSILKRLAKKGWVTVKRINSRRLAYALTPAGTDVIARRSYGYLKRTVRDAVDYKAQIDAVVRRARAAGYTAVIVVGQSELAFIVEHAAVTLGMGFATTSRVEWERRQETMARRFFAFLSENEGPLLSDYDRSPAGPDSAVETYPEAGEGRAHPEPAESDRLAPPSSPEPAVFNLAELG